MKTVGKVLGDLIRGVFLTENTYRFETVTMELKCSAGMSESGKISVDFSLNAKHVQRENPHIDFNIG